jgi:hypothetical protein
MLAIGQAGELVVMRQLLERDLEPAQRLDGVGHQRAGVVGEAGRQGGDSAIDGIAAQASRRHQDGLQELVERHKGEARSDQGGDQGNADDPKRFGEAWCARQRIPGDESQQRDMRAQKGDQHDLVAVAERHDPGEETVKAKSHGRPLLGEQRHRDPLFAVCRLIGHTTRQLSYARRAERMQYRCKYLAQVGSLC